MPTWMKPVFSSMISEVGYDSDNEELLVKFNSGKTAAYKGASEGLAEDLSRAPSVGQMFRSEVKPFFTNFRYI